MLNEESIDAIKCFHKRRESRLRQRLTETADLMEKYRLLKIIQKNRRFERELLQKYLDIGGKSSTIKLSDISEDGAPYGNDNAAKDHVVKASSGQKKRIRKQLKGIETKLHGTVSGVYTHACDRMVERSITSEQVKDTLTDPTITFPGNTGNRTCYQKGTFRVVLDNDTREIVSAITLGDDDDD